jgi:curved DNA-binding protein CbpA
MAADPRIYFEILRMSPSATLDQIKQAYRALAKALHPDLNRGPNTGSGRTFGVLNQKPTNKREIRFRLRVGTA